ncbi:uncharacterized protein TM35_000201070 [Trypanosoma theileri]|uniref:Uncharacterized protein n=1 Tax=Trypanosoma theileri TaxID=67003 RepID=A0A1X0NT30_9TRYP|nr:uncharacterized protein TM35_000201070 [Trypanosoma theileri]ORC87698.1 hypothetical protein TM35_000201070 [Trypanosoma theileri]
MRRSSVCSSSSALGTDSSCFSGRNREYRHLSGDVYRRLFEQSQQPKCNCQAPLSNEEDDSDDANCTFVPVVNRTHEELLSRWTEGVSVFERLYGNALFLHRKREQQMRNCFRQKETRKQQQQQQNSRPVVSEYSRVRSGSIPDKWRLTTTLELQAPQSRRYYGETNPLPLTRMRRENNKKFLMSPLLSYALAH